MALTELWTSKTVLTRCLRHFLPLSSPLSAAPQTRHNSNRTSVVRYGRQKYQRVYPVLLVRPDGSAINLRYQEPRRLLMLPVDITTLSEEERKGRMRRRDPKRGVAKTKVEEFDGGDFNAADYSRFWKKKE